MKHCIAIIEAIYRFLWGDLLVLPLPGGDSGLSPDGSSFREPVPGKDTGEGRQYQTVPLPVPGKDRDSILASLEEGVKAIFTSERYADYLKTLSRFHRYSFQNTLLIAMQRPDATLVAGYKNWQSLGRQVRKGEKGITIVAPAPVRRKREQAVLDKDGHPVLSAEGKPETEEVEVVIPRFKTATVFDISQTEGRPVETLEPGELTEGVRDYALFLAAIEAVSPVPVRMGEIPGGAKGCYDSGTREIIIRKGMSESQTIKTAVHETCHALLHDRDKMKENGMEKDRMTKEVQAESVAYCVCAAFRIDTSGYSFPYIAGWSSGRELKELRTSMDTIRKTAGELIDGISENFRTLAAEKQKEREREGSFFLDEIGECLENAEQDCRYVRDLLGELGIRPTGKIQEKKKGEKIL